MTPRAHSLFFATTLLYHDFFIMIRAGFLLVNPKTVTVKDEPGFEPNSPRASLPDNASRPISTFLDIVDLFGLIFETFSFSLRLRQSVDTSLTLIQSSTDVRKLAPSSASSLPSLRTTSLGFIPADAQLTAVVEIVLCVSNGAHGCSRNTVYQL